jgi:hypothetical protein
LNRTIDLAGTLERCAKRERGREEEQRAQEEVHETAAAYQRALVRARKQEAQAPQQVPADSIQARERGLTSYNPAAYRRYDVEKLKELQERDPVLFFFRFANTSIDRA